MSVRPQQPESREDLTRAGEKVASDGGTPVDVAIPTHGDPAFLAQAIESVLAQTHSAFTLTVSDNGPGGGAAQAVVEKYLDDPRVRYTATGGVSQGTNLSHCIATGSAPYVGLLPHDDLWDTTFLARRVAFLDEHPDCGYVFSACRQIDEPGTTIARQPYLFRGGLIPRDEYIPALYGRNEIPMSGVLVRRATYQAAGEGFLDEYLMAMDWEMWFRLAVHAGVGYLPVRDNSTRVHVDSISSNSKRWGEVRLHFMNRADDLLRREMPQYALPDGTRVERKASMYLHIGLDAVEHCAADDARAALASAWRTSPRTTLGLRGFCIVTGVAGGAPGRRFVQSLRATHERLGRAVSRRRG